jgi:hypothetical protein
MKRFVEGADRTQITLLPARLDDYIAEDNPVRVVDVFIDELDLIGLGFDGMGACGDGASCIPSGSALEDLRLRLPQPPAVESAPGTRDAAQR